MYMYRDDMHLMSGFRLKDSVATCTCYNYKSVGGSLSRKLRCLYSPIECV